MTKSDIVLCHPRDMFYPLFVRQLNRDRDLFNKVIIVMTPPELQMDFTAEIKARVKGATILEPDIQKMTVGGLDWRNVAIHEGLDKSTSESVLFLEQDLFWKPGFMEFIIDNLRLADTIGFREGNRFHPACLLVRRRILNRTSLDFSAKPPEYDHFGGITEKLKEGSFMLFEPNPNWCHLASTTYDYRKDREKYTSEFWTYHLLSRELEQPESWREFCDQKKIPKMEISERVAGFFV